MTVAFIGFFVCYTRLQQNVVPAMGFRKFWLQGLLKALLKTVIWVPFAILQAKCLEFYFNQCRIYSVLVICLFFSIPGCSFIHTYKHICNPWLILICHSHNEEFFTGKDFLGEKMAVSIPRILYCQLWLMHHNFPQTLSMIITPAFHSSSLRNKDLLQTWSSPIKKIKLFALSNRVWKH